MEIPYVAFSNDELEDEDLPIVKKGDSITCPHCGGSHTLRATQNTEGRDSILLFYKCGEKVYLAAIHGKLVISLFPRGT